METGSVRAIFPHYFAAKRDDLTDAVDMSLFIVRFGNPVNRRLKGCDGCMCHEYDHVMPVSVKEVLEREMNGANVLLHLVSIGPANRMQTNKEFQVIE